jgi:hypothetical protein
MKADAAWQIVKAGFRSSAELQGLLEFLKSNCSPQEYQIFSRAIATAIHSINVELTDRVLRDHPEMAERIESDLARFGRLT